MEVGSRWYGAFGGFGGLGVVFREFYADGVLLQGWVDKLDGKVEDVANKTKEGISNWRKR
jgi:hypothetical protein